MNSACDRNVELAQLIQQKLDAYKAGKYRCSLIDRFGEEKQFLKSKSFQMNRPLAKALKKPVRN